MARPAPPSDGNPFPAELKLSAREFAQISSLLRDRAGIDLREGKEALVQVRLGKKIREGGFGSFQDYYRHVTADRTGESLIAMIDALTTNYTSFLREARHFEFLRETILRELAPRECLAVWSAACATGEEPYSIACTLADAFGPQLAHRVRLAASDISTRALEKAGRGVYPAAHLEALPRGWRDRYFLPYPGGLHQVRPELRRLVRFERRNLMEPFPAGVRWRVIFCRNVMIYFNRTVQDDLVNRLAACIEPGGYLFIGHAESLSGIRHPLEYVAPAIYRCPLRRPA